MVFAQIISFIVSFENLNMLLKGVGEKRVSYSVYVEQT